MSDLVPSERVEEIVGVKRHATEHWGRAVSADQTIYILHSERCKANTSDLRDCPYSRALDLGVDIREWTEDSALLLTLHDGHLAPVGGPA